MNRIQDDSTKGDFVKIFVFSEHSESHGALMYRLPRDLYLYSELTLTIIHPEVRPLEMRATISFRHRLLKHC